MRRHAPALVPRTTDPLAPAAVVGIGAVARALCARLLEESDDDLALLDGVRAATVDGALVVVVRGASARLPWVDGALYLGEHAPGLFAPTSLAFDAPPSLIRDALARHVPVALFPGPTAGMRVSLRNALPLSRDVLRAVVR